MKVSSIFIWSPNDDQLRSELATLTGRHVQRRISHELKKRLIRRSQVNGHSLTRIKVEMSVDETGAISFCLHESHKSPWKMFFYAPLLLVRRRWYPFMAITPFRQVKDDLADIERSLIFERNNPDLPF